MSVQITDLRSTVAVLRRRRRVLAAAAVLGLVAGATYVMLQPPQLMSTALVLLPKPIGGEDTTPEVDTHVRIATSVPILQTAGSTLTPPLPPRTVEEMLEVSAPTTQLVEIEAFSTDASQAQALSQAVADSFVAYIKETQRAGTEEALGELEARAKDLQAQIARLQEEIIASKERRETVSPRSADGRREAQLLGTLQREQADLSLQLDKVKDQIATMPSAPSGSAGATVVQPATAATGSSLLQRLIWMPLGAVICTLLAVSLLFAIGRRDLRVRRRDEVADAVGSPVLAGVRSMPQRSVAGWSMLLKTYEATAVESWAFRQVLRGLVSADRRAEARVTGNADHPRSLTVVSLSGDVRGVAIGPQLAAFASSLGIPTRLVAAVGQDRAAPLWAACAADRAGPSRPGLFVGDVPDGEAIDLTVTLVVVDRMQPDLGDAPATEATILSVAAGTATEQELARVAVAVDDAGRRIDGVVVADPDQTDRTSGRHTMEERAHQMALPVRLTGIESSEVPVGDPNRRRP